MMESKTETAVTTLLSDIASTQAELLPVIQCVRQLATAAGDNVCESVRFVVCRTDEQPPAFVRLTAVHFLSEMQVQRLNFGSAFFTPGAQGNLC